LAPVAASLMQGNAAAPVSIDDVLLVPHASAGQKAVGFEWADANGSQGYILWDKFFAAATKLSAGTTDTTAQTLASFGYMTPAFGAGLSLGYRELRQETTTNIRANSYYALSQIKLFGSAPLGANDLYGSLVWAKGSLTTVWVDAPNVPSFPKTYQRSDSLSLNAGLRHGPAAGQEGLGWNLTGTIGQNYVRVAGSKEESQYIFKVLGQVGQAYVIDGITFLPGADVFYNHANGKGTEFDDYDNEFGIAPNASITVPVFEHWTLRGGLKYAAYTTINDGVQGDNSAFQDWALISQTTGNFGVRYARDRWAAEAGVSNGFLNRGPYFVSGANGDLFYTLGFTVNLK